MSTLWESLLQRDAAAWDTFYDEHTQELYGFVFRLVRGDHSAAADVFQNTWLDAVGHIEQFDPARGELRGWLFGIARQKAALHWRRRTASNQLFATVGPGHAVGNMDGALLPEDVLDRLECSAVVRASLLALPPDRRQVLIYKYVDGLPVNEIAAKIGKSSKAVESLLARARRQLRSLLGSYFPNRDGGRKDKDDDALLRR